MSGHSKDRFSCVYENGINRIDLHVGSRIRERRASLNMKRGELACALGVTFQQIQKYEEGRNQVFASRLFALTEVLDVPVSFFFEGVPDYVNLQYMGRSAVAHETQPVQDHLSILDVITLARSYYQITDTSRRKRLLGLIRSFG